jgi:hypothetical protein
MAKGLPRTGLHHPSHVVSACAEPSHTSLRREAGDKRDRWSRPCLLNARSTGSVGPFRHDQRLCNYDVLAIECCCRRSVKHVTLIDRFRNPPTKRCVVLSREYAVPGQSFWWDDLHGAPSVIYGLCPAQLGTGALFLVDSRIVIAASKTISPRMSSADTSTTYSPGDGAFALLGLAVTTRSVVASLR